MPLGNGETDDMALPNFLPILLTSLLLLAFIIRGPPGTSHALLVLCCRFSFYPILLAILTCLLRDHSLESRVAIFSKFDPSSRAAKCSRLVCLSSASPPRIMQLLANPSFMGNVHPSLVPAHPNCDTLSLRGRCRCCVCRCAFNELPCACCLLF